MKSINIAPDIKSFTAQNLHSIYWFLFSPIFYGQFVIHEFKYSSIHARLHVMRFSNF